MMCYLAWYVSLACSGDRGIRQYGLLWPRQLTRKDRLGRARDLPLPLITCGAWAKREPRYSGPALFARALKSNRGGRIWPPHFIFESLAKGVQISGRGRRESAGEREGSERKGVACGPPSIPHHRKFGHKLATLSSQILPRKRSTRKFFMTSARPENSSWQFIPAENSSWQLVRPENFSCPPAARAGHTDVPGKTTHHSGGYTPPILLCQYNGGKT